MSYLADVQMPETQKEEEVASEVAERVDLDYESASDEEVAVAEEPVITPSPAEKMPKIKSSDIFKTKAPPAIKPIIPVSLGVTDEEIISKAEPPVKKKRVLSEKQLAALQKGRDTRAAKKKAAVAQTKQVHYQEPVAPTPQPVAPTQQTTDPMKGMFTQEELSAAVLQGVETYDNMRKKRKESKKKAQAVQNHEKKVFHDINAALGGQMNDPYANCFNF